MKVTRRDFTVSLGALAVGGAAFRAVAPAVAQSGPIKIGWIAALTGASSAPGIGINRGVIYAAEKINKAGGVKGRQIEVITRDTQGDPTKAVNAAQEMISQLQVHAIWGPSNSGESLAVTPILARAKVPNVHPCVVDSLIDEKKYPNAFRISPSMKQWEAAVRSYSTNILKVKKIAVIGDTTGLGVAATLASVAGFKAAGVEVVYERNIDATQPDMMPDMLRAKAGGADAIAVWSVSTGMDARLFNTRATMGWDVPFVGHPSLASGEIAGLIDRPSNWENVFAIGYKSCSYDAAGKLPAQSQELVEGLQQKFSLADTLLWWVASGVDGINLVAKAVAETGSSDREATIQYWNSLKTYPGYLGEYRFSETNHNGFQTEEVVMSLANSARNGTFLLAPGYA